MYHSSYTPKPNFHGDDWGNSALQRGEERIEEKARKPLMLPSVLVVEDDELTRKTLAVILESKDFKVTCSSSIHQALSVLRTNRFDAIVMTITLLSRDDLRLHQLLYEVAPHTIKLVITVNYSSVMPAVQALNFEADAYFAKPVDPEELVKTIREKLAERLKTADPAKDEVFNGPLLEGADDGSFHEYIESIANELVAFNLTRNQAKVYAALVAVDFAVPADLATLSGIRREEVYRLMPDLVERGLAIKQMSNPIRYRAASPETVISRLMKAKLKKATEEINSLIAKRDATISRLQKTKTLSSHANMSVENVVCTEDLLQCFERAIEKTNKTFDAAIPFEFVSYAHLNLGQILTSLSARGINCRIVTEAGAFAKSAPWSMRIIKEPNHASLRTNGLVHMRFVNKLPFNVTVYDDKEAFWGEFNLQAGRSSLRATAQSHVEIAKAAFENLWSEAKLFEDIQNKHNGGIT
jgi:two-component system, chemotaxis family, response regulator PixH